MTSYKKIFQIISLLFVIWAGTANSKLSQQEILAIENIILESGLKFVADNVPDNQNYICSSYSFREILNVLLIIKENYAEAKQMIRSKLGIPPELQDANKEYLSQKSANENLIIQNFLLNRNPLTPGEKKLLSKLQFTDFYDNLPLREFLNIASKVNTKVFSLTNGLIKNPLKLDNISLDTCYIAINVIYYKSAWDFFCKSTKIMFHCLNEKSVEVKRVPAFETSKNAANEIKYMEHNGHKVYWLPLEDKEHLMCIIDPVKGENPANVLRNTDDCKKIIMTAKNSKSLYNALNEGKNDSQQTNFTLTLPKFFIEREIDLSDFLPYSVAPAVYTSGLPMAFLPEERLSKIIQTAAIKVNESGVEAAAATVGYEHDGLRDSNYTNILIDHPFAYMIVNSTNNNVVFSGTVYNPKYTE